MKRASKLIIVLLTFLLLGGCAGKQLAVETPTDIYFKALGIWYDAGKQFKFYYEHTDDQALKEKWDTEFRPILIKSKEILNLWKFHVDTDKSTNLDKEAWKNISDELLYYIATQMKAKEAT